MEKRVRWENKYLIPHTTLTNILTKYMTLRRMWTRVPWIKKYLIPNTSLTIILANRKRLRRMETMGEQIPNTQYHIDKHIDQIYDTQKEVDKGTMDEKIPNT